MKSPTITLLELNRLGPAVLLAICLSGCPFGCRHAMAKGEAASVAHPPIRQFVTGGYADPLQDLSRAELEARYHEILALVDGWENAMRLLDSDVWIYQNCFSCPACHPQPVRNNNFLELKDGKYICRECHTTIIPSETYKPNRQIPVTVQGETFNLDVYQEPAGLRLNFSLIASMESDQRKLLIETRDSLVGVLALLAQTGDPFYTKQCLEMLLTVAKRHRALVLDAQVFHDTRIPALSAGAILHEYPIQALFHGKPRIDSFWILAYAAVRDNDAAWAAYGDPAELKEKVRRYLIDMHEYVVTAQLFGAVDTYSNLGNLIDRKLRGMAALATYCDYPKALLDCAHFMDATVRLYSTFDNVEAEGGSYQQMVVAHLSRICHDAQIAYDSLVARGLLEPSPARTYIEEMLHKAKSVHVGNLRYPNGDTVRIGDAWGMQNLEARQFKPVAMKPDNAWGYFPLCSDQRTYAGLSLSPLFYSHHHDDDLGMVLWGSGIELLADYGYNKTYYRYYTTNALAHNGSTVHWREAWKPSTEEQAVVDAYNAYKAQASPNSLREVGFIHEDWKTMDDLLPIRRQAFNSYYDHLKAQTDYDWRRAAVHAYQPAGLTPYIDASSLGPVSRGINVRDRLLMLVPVHASSAYTVDIHRLAGGQLHQIGLQAPFGETVNVATGAPPASGEAVEARLAFWRQKLGRYYQASFTDVKPLDASDPWKLTWKTQTSGVTMDIWGPGGDSGHGGALLLCGLTPDTTRDPYRSEHFRPPDADPIPFQPHAYLRLEAAADATAELESVVPLVYTHELSDRQATDKVIAVQTLTFGTGEPGCRQPIVLQLSFASGRRDYVYSSCDTTERTMAGFTFSGRGCWVSLPAADAGQAWAAMTQRDSKVAGHGLGLSSAPTQSLTILAAAEGRDGNADIGTFTVDGMIANPELYLDHWASVDYGGGVSYIYKVTAIHSEGDKTLVRIEGRPGMERTATGWRHVRHPFKQGGEVATLKLVDSKTWSSPAFQKAINN